MFYRISGLKRDQRLTDSNETIVLHSVHQHALNFLGESHQLYTVIDSSSGGPFTLTVSQKDFLLLKKQEGNRGLIKASQLRWGDSVIDYAQAQNAALQPNTKIMLREFETLLRKYLKEVEVNRENLLIDRAYTLLEKASTFQVITDSIGLGVGLTPTVDDFVVGILAVFTAFNIPLPAFQVGSTTDVSKQALVQAQQGFFTEKITLFLAEPTWAYFVQLLETGSTSGTDLLFGMLKGTELIRRNK